MDDPESVVSPGGVGFDINCGVRLLRTNLLEGDVAPVKEQLTQMLFDHIPVGVGSKGMIPMTERELEEALEMGMDWSLREGYAWIEDKEHVEEFGRMVQADSSKVSDRAKKRGLPQLGTLGAGNHYAEIQVVDEIFDHHTASKMGITQIGQVCVMIHCGSRGLGHQVATDSLVAMEKAMARDNIAVNDRQLACARINSEDGQNYLAGMAAAANFAWVNRSAMTYLCRQAFAKTFGKSPRELDMHLIYDVSHNIAKIEEHVGSNFALFLAPPFPHLSPPQIDCKRGKKAPSSPPERFNSRLWAASPFNSRRLSVHRPAGSHWGDHGHLQLRANRHGKGHD